MRWFVTVSLVSSPIAVVLDIEPVLITSIKDTPDTAAKADPGFIPNPPSTGMDDNDLIVAVTVSVPSTSVVDPVHISLLFVNDADAGNVPKDVCISPTTVWLFKTKTVSPDTVV